MTGLLVSVRSADEAVVALEAGADLIDVKEPSRGSLGAAVPDVWRAVRAAVGGRCSTSAALGELLEEPLVEAAAIRGFSFAKIGLAGCRNVPTWQAKWRQVMAQLPDTVSSVAVAYADHRSAYSPSPLEVVSAAQELGCETLLIDTFEKKSGDLFSNLDDAELAEVCEHTRASNLRLVLAGSLRLDTLERALQHLPDYVAVRGAACHGARHGMIASELIRELAQRVRSHVAISSPR